MARTIGTVPIITGVHLALVAGCQYTREWETQANGACVLRW